MIDELRKRIDGGIVRLTRQQVLCHLLLASASHRAFMSKPELAYHALDQPLTIKTFPGVKIEGYYNRVCLREIIKNNPPAGMATTVLPADNTTAGPSQPEARQNRNCLLISDDEDDEDDFTLLDQTSYSGYGERTENERNEYRGRLTKEDLRIMNFCDFCETIKCRWVKDKKVTGGRAARPSIRSRDKNKGYWIYSKRPKRIHIRWSVELYSPPAYIINLIGDCTLADQSYADLDPAVRLQLNKAYQELVCYVPWSISPDMHFLTQSERDMLIKDPEKYDRYSRLRLQLFFGVYYKMFQTNNQKFAPPGSAWHRDQVYSNSMYQALNHNRDVYEDRKSNNGVYIRECLADEELAGTDITRIQPDIDGMNDADAEYPGVNDFLPSDMMQDILKQSAPTLSEITVCHPSQNYWQDMKSITTTKSRVHEEQKWFMAKPPKPQTTMSQLTPLQRKAVELATSVNSRRRKQDILYIIGKAGCGKTEVALHICQHFKDKVQAGAGTAKASLLFNGPNLHAMFGWAMNESSVNYSNSDSGRRKLKNLQDYYKKVEVFVIDEVGAISASELATLSFSLKHIFENDKPFGGRKMIFLGDTGQLKPVRSSAIYENSVKDSTVKKKIKRKSAAQSSYQERQKEKSPAYRKRTQEGHDLYKHLEDNCIHLLQGKRNSGLLQDIVDRLRNGEQTLDDLIKLRRQRMKFPDFNCDFGVNYENNACFINNLKGLWTAACEINARVHVCPANYHDNGNNSSVISYLRSLSASNYSYAVDVLCLAEGCEVRLIYNVDTAAGLVNGATGRVAKIIYANKDVDGLLDKQFPPPYCVLVEFESFRGFLDRGKDEYYFPFPKNKKLVPLFQKQFNCTADLPNKTVRSKQKREMCYREQFPIDLSRYVTIHRSQGQSLQGYNISIDANLSTSTSELQNDTGSLLYVGITRTNQLSHVFLETIHPDIWLRLGQSDSEKKRREILKKLNKKAEQFAKDNKFYYPEYVNEQKAADKQRPSKKEINAEWSALLKETNPPSSIANNPISLESIIPSLSSIIPGALGPVQSERHIGIDQGIKAFAVCVVHKIRGENPKLVYANCYDLSTFIANGLPKNFTAPDLLLHFNQHHRLLELLEPKSSLTADGIPDADRVIVHLEQVSIENTYFKVYTKQFGQLLQQRTNDLSSLIVKLSSSNVHRRLGPSSKLGPKIIEACNLQREPMQGDYREKKARSQKIFRYLMECCESDLEDTKITIGDKVREWWNACKPQVNSGDTFLSGRLHDLGDAFLHAIDEVVCQVSNYRQLIPADPVLQNNRTIIVHYLREKVYWVIITCYFNKFVLEDLGHYETHFTTATIFKMLDPEEDFVRYFPPSLHAAISYHDGHAIYPAVDKIKIIVHQASSKTKETARQLGCLTNTAVVAMEYYLTNIAAVAKEGKTLKPRYKYQRILDDGKIFEVTRSIGKHTNNIITLLDWVTQNNETYTKDRMLRFAPMKTEQFFDRLVDTSINNKQSTQNNGSQQVSCNFEMLQLTCQFQNEIVEITNSHDKQKVSINNLY
jgi:RecA/RadA recombinase